MMRTLNSLKNLVASIVVTAFCGGLATAQTPMTMQEIEAAWAQGRFDAVRSGLAELVKTDQSARTAMRLGRVLVDGLGGPVDRENGLRWLQYAADKDHLPALTLIGRVFLSPGQDRDPVKAADFFKNAATRGDAEAKYYLGLLFQDGVGVIQNDAEAFSWMRGASEGGYGPAMLALSRYYTDGRGTDPDLDKARDWLTEAASAQVPEAQFALANSYLTGPNADPVSAVPLLQSAATRGHVPSQRALGTLYLTGAGDVSVQAEQAEQLLRAAAQAGDIAAINNLGTAYLTGDVLTRDVATGVTLLERASDAGLARATFTLAQVYDLGAGVPRDETRAIRLYRTADAQGSLPAKMHLAELVLSEAYPGGIAPHTAVPWIMTRMQNGGDDAAADWLELQASNGVRPAQAALGAWYLKQGTQIDRAIELLEAAAIAGHVPSQFQLGPALTTGLAGKIDYVQAHSWLNIAATSGQGEAAQMRDAITDLMTPEQIAEAQGMARTFFENARRMPVPAKQ